MEENVSGGGSAFGGGRGSWLVNVRERWVVRLVRDERATVSLVKDGEIMIAVLSFSFAPIRPPSDYPGRGIGHIHGRL